MLIGTTQPTASFFLLNPFPGGLGRRMFLIQAGMSRQEHFDTIAGPYRWGFLRQKVVISQEGVPASIVSPQHMLHVSITLLIPRCEKRAPCILPNTSLKLGCLYATLATYAPESFHLAQDKLISCPGCRIPRLIWSLHCPRPEWWVKSS